MTPLALVTGGSRGIGAHVVAGLRAAGWDVLAPGRAELDFDCKESVMDYCAWQNQRGICRDAVIFCHGEWYSRNSQYMQHYEAQYHSRVIYPHWVMRSQVNNLQQGRDFAAVMVASTRGFIGGIDTGPYSAACAAQIALMQGYAREFKAPLHATARFNCVAPGLTETDMGQIVKATGGAKPGTLGQPPEAVAAAVLRLVTDGTSNGRVVRVVDSQVSEARWNW